MGSANSTEEDDDPVNDDEALFEAAQHGDEEEVARLLEAMANVNHLMLDLDWQTPVFVAAQEGNIECLKLLLAARNCDPDRADRFHQRR